MNPLVVHLTNVLTHVCGFYWLWYAKWNMLPTWIMLGSIMASCIMHISETKHGLNGMGRFAHISHAALNVDRFFAVALALTCLLSVVFWQNWVMYSTTFLALSVCLFLGEKTKNLTYYTALHTIWHLGVFYMAGLIIVNNVAAPHHQWITFRPM